MIGLGQIFTILFVTLGPLRLLAPFAQRTREVDGATVRRIAVWTFAVATFGIVAGSFLGRSMLQNWGVSIPALRLTGGIVFFLVALRQLLEQYEPMQTAPSEALPASPLAAATRLVFPMVLTPYGVVAVITLLTTSTDTQRTVTILGLVLVVMVLDLLAMLLARRILVGFAVVILQVIGSVLAVLQVALSVEFMIAGLRSLGVLAES